MSRLAIIGLFLFAFAPNALAQQLKLVNKPDRKSIEIQFKSIAIATYSYSDSVAKPILFPLRTKSGIEITRGYPLKPRPGERTDHPHQVGLWLNYESVNGIDFWNNSFAIDPSKRSQYGTIKHRKVTGMNEKPDGAELQVSADWVTSENKILLSENTAYYFSVSGPDVTIDRITILTAMQDTVVFRDVKDGLLGLRIARELEMPSQQQDKFVDSQGNVTTVAQLNNDGVTGIYINKDSVTGDNVWGTRSPWVCLNGMKDGKNISIAIFDHERNVGYPTYWHARGYGLFAANPLGQKIFSNGKEELNFRLKKNQTAIFRYRIVIHEGEPYDLEALNEISKRFIAQYAKFVTPN